MTTSVWRTAHLILAIFSFLFIIMASVTGAILSFEPIIEKSQPYKIENFNDISLSQVIPVLKNSDNEILDLSVDENQFVTIQGFDVNGNDFTSIINPLTGEFIAEPLQQSDFFQWVTALHRSLFIHETGRFIVGFITFLLLLIAISGTVLIIKRQQGIQNFFKKISKDYFAQYYHVAAGRLLLIPILIISLSGTYLFLLRFEAISIGNHSTLEYKTQEPVNPIALQSFPAFQNTKLKDVVKIEFPFDLDVEEYYKVKLSDREVLVSQYSGEIVQETIFSKAEVLQNLSLDLHTGRTNSIWAIVLGIASVNILFFVWSGFVMTYKRTKTKFVKNKFTAQNAEVILLVGSENGSTITFANKVYEQLLAANVSVFIAPLNQYQTYINAKQMLFFTATYGIGEAPTNAKKFQKLLESVNQPNIEYAVVGFGSRAYKDFCAFAFQIDQWLSKKSWAKQSLPVFTVNDKSPIEFSEWITQFNQTFNYSLNSSPDRYVTKMPRVKSMRVLQKTDVFKDDTTFTVTLKTNKKYKSGDLLAIYPANDYRERLYSIGKVNGQLQLVVKLHEFGLGSQYLYGLKPNEVIKARLVKNANFYFPSQANQVVLIANGTGIAPFLGMIDENVKHIETHLYVGFRYKNDTVSFYQNFANSSCNQNKLTSFAFAFSREAEKQYVMDLIQKDAKKIADILANNGVVMVCGALAMQTDVEKVLHEICMLYNQQPFSFYQANNQFLTDCY